VSPNAFLFANNVSSKSPCSRAQGFLFASRYTYFSIFRSEEEAFPTKPFGVGFARKMWRYGETAAIGICLEALYQLKQVEVTLTLAS
jgi:hypothetical protein